MSFKPLFAGFALLVLSAGAANAQEKTIAEIQYSPKNVTVSEVYRSIRKIAKNECGVRNGPQKISERAAANRCVADVMTRTVANSGNRELISFHQSNPDVRRARRTGGKNIRVAKN